MKSVLISINKPRGVLFFAGPTGTSKTELTKAVADGDPLSGSARKGG